MLRLHAIGQSDPGELHDHPWDFVSIILKGSYLEYLGGGGPDCYNNGVAKRLVVRRAWRPARRNAEQQHRVIIPTDPETGERPVVWTLCITGPERREWGFWTRPVYDLTTEDLLEPSRFIPWQQHKIPSDE